MNITTKLEAVNTLLMSIGEDPVNALGTGLDDQTVAEAVLDEVTRKVQVRGWSWNTEHRFKLMRDGDQEVTLANNVLSIDFHNKTYVLRGNRVYDRVSHSYTLPSDLTATVTFCLDWDDLPEVARQFILYSSGRVFQARQVGSQVLNQFTQQDERSAWAALIQNEEGVGNRSIFQNAEIAHNLNRSPSVPVSTLYPGQIYGSY